MPVLASPSPSPVAWLHAASASPTPWAAGLEDAAALAEDASALPTPVPPWLPPMLALVCSVIAGLTSFGEAILYHVLWSLAAAVGILPAGRKDILTRAVTYLTIMPIANLPLFVYVARKELKHCLIYGCMMAVTGMAMVPVGAGLLYHSDVTKLKVGVGLFFLFFSVLKLSFGIASLGRAREDSIRFGKAWVGSLEDGDRVALREHGPGGEGSKGGSGNKEGVAGAGALESLSNAEKGAGAGSSASAGGVGLDPSHPTWWAPGEAGAGAGTQAAAVTAAPASGPSSASLTDHCLPSSGLPHSVVAEFTLLSPAPELAAIERRIDHGAVATDIALGQEPAPPPPPRPLPRVIKDLGPVIVERHGRRASLSHPHPSLPGTAVARGDFSAQGSGPLPTGKLADEPTTLPATSAIAAPAAATADGVGVVTVVSIDADGVVQVVAPPMPRPVPYLFRRHHTLAVAYKKLCVGWEAFKKHCCQPISPRFAVVPTLLVLLATGSASGLLGGLFGTGGPPQMIAFAFLMLNKDDIRGVSVVYGCLELSVRVWAYSTQGDGRGGFDSSEAPIYSAIAVASWIGFSIGTYLRRFADTDLIIRILLALVFVSSAILLGALDDAAVALAFVSVTVVWVSALALVYWRPPGIRSALDSLTDMRYTCSPRLSALFAPYTEAVRRGLRQLRMRRAHAAGAGAAWGTQGLDGEPLSPIKRRASVAIEAAPVEPAGGSGTGTLPAPSPGEGSASAAPPATPTK